MAVENLGDIRHLSYHYPRSAGFRAQAPYIALQRLKRHIRLPDGPRPIGHILHNRQSNQIVVGIPKVGTRTLLATLRTGALSPQVEEQEATLSEVLFRIPLGQSVDVAAFVRNPWARVFSAWSDKIARLDSDGHRARRIARHKGLWPGMPFANFVEWLASPAGTDAHADRHWMSQHKFIATDRAPVHWRKLEGLGPQLSLFGQSLPMRQENSTDLSHNRYRAAYTPDLVEIIAKRYATDIKTFGYSFD